MAENLYDLTPEKRLIRFYELAEESRHLAEGIREADVKAAYVRIAATWNRLARELEAEINAQKKGPADSGTSGAAMQSQGEKAHDAPPETEGGT